MDEFFTSPVDRNPFSFHIDNHLNQIEASNRFQEFSTNWAKKKSTTLYDLESIKDVPISMI